MLLSANDCLRDDSIIFPMKSITNVRRKLFRNGSTFYKLRVCCTVCTIFYVYLQFAASNVRIDTNNKYGNNNSFHKIELGESYKFKVMGHY